MQSTICILHLGVIIIYCAAMIQTKIIYQYTLVINILLFALFNSLDAQELDQLEILRSGYPRAFFFRQSERLVRSGSLTFEEWEQNFSRLGGIEGKILDEEIPGTSIRNIDVFTLFKKHHPEQLVLIHFNGNSRDIRYNTEKFFAGHWLYHTGCKLTRDVEAGQDISILHVADPGLFRTNIGRYKNKNEDLIICSLTSDGRPDFSRAEQLELISKDKENKILTVRRGAFGTTALKWTNDRSYVAAHATGGPWGDQSNLLWLYNYSLNCPRDSQGRTCSDVLVEDIASLFEPGGRCEILDGIQLDILRHFIYEFRGKRGIHADTDGRRDSNKFGADNDYGRGVYDFCRRLKERIGKNKLLIADGGLPNQRAFSIVNGIESEGWPYLHDKGIKSWSTGINRHRFWNTRCAKPAFHYVNHKYTYMAPGAARSKMLRSIPLDTTRLVLAACQMTDAAFTTFADAPTESGEEIGIYDELRMGTANKTNWLGRPLAPAIQLALTTEDLLAGQGKVIDENFLKRMSSGNASFERVNLSVPAVKISCADPNAYFLYFKLADVPLSSRNVVLRLHVRSEPADSCRPTMARYIKAACRRSQKANQVQKLSRALLTWSDSQWFEATFYFRDIKSDTYSFEFNTDGTKPVYLSNITLHAYPDVMLREFENGLVLANPSLEPFEFNLAQLSLGKRYRRLQGSANQDPKTNDGSKAGETVTIPPRDGLFLVKQK